MAKSDSLAGKMRFTRRFEILQRKYSTLREEEVLKDGKPTSEGFRRVERIEKILRAVKNPEDIRKTVAFALEVYSAGSNPFVGEMMSSIDRVGPDSHMHSEFYEELMVVGQGVPTDDAVPDQVYRATLYENSNDPDKYLLIEWKTTENTSANGEIKILFQTNDPHYAADHRPFPVNDTGKPKPLE